MVWKPGEWARSLPDSYYVQMEPVIRDQVSRWGLPEPERSRVEARHIFGRMEITQTTFIPWVRKAIGDLSPLRVLEIGCGSASVTVPFAMSAAHVTAFDLPGENYEVGRQRLDSLNIRNVDLRVFNVDWIDRYIEDPYKMFGPIDIVLCHALLEHLTLRERLKFLAAAWRHLPVGGYLVVIETHNRLYWHDWHSSFLPFFDQLPDELAHLWMAQSPRKDIPKGIVARNLEELEHADTERMYRWGRGLSFHEFYLSLGPDRFRVVNPWIIDRQSYAGWNEQYISVLAEQLEKVEPPPDVVFAQPSLDMILQKTGDPLM